jgi:hypothetical protein
MKYNAERFYKCGYVLRILQLCYGNVITSSLPDTDTKNEYKSSFTLIRNNYSNFLPKSNFLCIAHLEGTEHITKITKQNNDR